jgi:hypothetical protein
MKMRRREQDKEELIVSNVRGRQLRVHENTTCQRSDEQREVKTRRAMALEQREATTQSYGTRAARGDNTQSYGTQIKAVDAHACCADLLTCTPKIAAVHLVARMEQPLGTSAQRH